MAPFTNGLNKTNEIQSKFGQPNVYEWKLKKPDDTGFKYLPAKNK